MGTSAPDSVKHLVDLFDQNRDAYLAGGINEATLCRHYLDKFFAALGWDVGNTKDLPETLKQVVFESPVRRHHSTGFADYCFQIFGRPAFFVEAKLPGADLLRGKEPALQLRRYAYGKQLDVSILTNFEDLLIYNGLIPPKASDAATKALLYHCSYDHYVDNWQELLAMLAPQAVQDGSLKRLVSTPEAREGAIPLGTKLLDDIERWRIELAKNIAANNPRLGTPENADDLRFAVQQTIDRIIFLRNCEDRGLEQIGLLRALLAQSGTYRRLLDHFREADRRYNSGLFYLEAEKGRAGHDDVTPALRVDDGPLKGIIGDLYDGPYDFSHISPEVLGQVYEQFLGRVIRLTAGHRAKVEPKPEVKKAHGVYYTPAYIVDYIVKNTVGKLLKGKTPKAVTDLRILDPACGSGSFLLGAYQFLLDWHLNWYIADGPEKHKVELFRTDEEHARWQLSTEKKKRILLANIFGVDIDAQAVEVTKLSLLLKVLEGETAESVNTQLPMFKDRVLPDLDQNIRSGNSLIDLSQRLPFQTSLFDPAKLDDDDLRRMKPFDWRNAFPAITGKDGFDAVIGNPPYIRVQALNEWAPLEVEYYKQRYQSASKGNYDIYVVFVEKGLSLLNENGLLGFILPHKFFNAQYGKELRGLIAKGKHLSHVVHFGDHQVFEGATTYTCLMFLDKARADKFAFEKVDDLDEWRLTGKATSGSIPAKAITADEWNFAVGESASVLAKLRRMPRKLAYLADLFVGLQTDADDVYILEEVRRTGNRVECQSQATGRTHWFEDAHLKRLLKGSLNIRRYEFTDATKRLIFPYETINGKSVLIQAGDYRKRFPLTWKYLETNRDRLSTRNKGRMGREWYGYVYKKNHTRFGTPKIVVPSLATGSCFAFDSEGAFHFVGSGGGGGGGYGIELRQETGVDYLYLLGLLNSRVLSFFLRSVSTAFRGGYIALNRQYIEQLPIRMIDFSNKDDKARHDEMAELVTRMMELKKSHARAPKKQSPSQRQLLDQKVAITDHQIDALVYELYGLTEDEIRIVEAMK